MIKPTNEQAGRVPPALPDPVLEVHDLSVTFRGRGGRSVHAVRGVNFVVRPGETLALVGESGSGKSVTAMSALRLLDERSAVYDRGRILVRTPTGTVDMLTADSRTIRSVRGATVAMVFQEPMTSLNPLMTVGDQIAEAIALHAHARSRPRSRIRAAVVEAMARVGIRDPAARHGDYPHQFSGGMRQRVMIAMALACRPALLIADEPTTALDATVQAKILDLIRDQAQSSGMAVLLVTHDLGIVADRADRVGVMYAGRIVESGPVAEVLREPLHPYTRALLRCRPDIHRAGGRLATVADTIEDAGECRLQIAGRAMRLWLPGHESRPDDAQAADEPSLEEVAPGRFVCACDIEQDRAPNVLGARKA